MNKTNLTKFYFSTEITHHNLFNALQRYFNFVLNTDLKDFDEKKNINDSSLLLVINDEKENPRLLNITNNHSNIRTVVIGFDDNCLINLVDTSSLKSKFTSLLNSDLEINYPLFTKKELHEKVSLFFKDHGDISLFDRLNDVHYRILNGIKLYITGDLGFEDSKNEFLIPCVESWGKFKTRFENYSPYLILLGYKAEQTEIKTLINSYDNFIIDINSSLGKDSIEINMETLNKNVELVKKIDEILTKISKDLGMVNARLQDSGS